ncbi:hypothetical protein CGZ80_20280 [Rhodopirellula sp. MGV]|nr:hypothetical protein CGZ80_20280 [Rhodopirellula sp. MGV]PNY38010.1 hypothetical protein C2E31_04835 [Rhodopirellula baltica]
MSDLGERPNDISDQATLLPIGCLCIKSQYRAAGQFDPQVNGLPLLIKPMPLKCSVWQFDGHESAGLVIAVLFCKPSSPLVERGNAIAFELAKISNGQLRLFKATDPLTPLLSKFWAGSSRHRFLHEKEGNPPS